MKTKEKVGLIHSIKVKIILVVFLAIVVSTGMNLWTVIPLMENNMQGTIQHYMKDVTLIAGQDLDREVSAVGLETVLTPEQLGAAVGDIKIKEMDSSYAYVVSADGTMLYHPTAEKIGQPVENQAVTSLVEEISKGNRPETDVIVYDFNGTTKYAAFYISADSDYIVVITADEDEVFADMNSIVKRCVESAGITAVLCTIVALFIAIRIVKPIEKITAIVGRISGLDFREDQKQAAISKKKDESGMMGRSIEYLRNELVGVVKKITGQSKELYNASQTLSVSASETSISVEQVEKAISEIAQGATSQAQETQTATENVIVMGNMIEETNEEVEKLRASMRTMRDAGNTAMDILKELNAVNQKTKDAMQVIYEQTNVTNESALKIKEATNIITEIAEETNLLSLNASIEAARAGEQGRGFAVVAAQIQKLAEQSNESARQIEEIINILIAESQKSVETMEEVKVVIEKQNENVANTENAFQNVKNGIDNSIEGIRTIAGKTEKLDEARVKVVDVVQNLTAIAQENAASTEETSASAAEVGAIMTNIAENANQLNQIANELEESVKQFITE
ncbi:MAG: methyl-accepting chemotaxis protein [Lachnospiraceae bacterium]|nr:methyl-accepting chemotaxis protein [Lachnospiraceae bacterium]